MAKKHKKAKRYFAYTDGSVREPQGYGGSAYLITNHDKSDILYRWCEFFEIATNNQMELIATIEAVHWFLDNVRDEESYLVVVTDSRYCEKGFNEWMDGWASRNWKTTSNKPPKNFLLWKNLYTLKHLDQLEGRVFFQWVKGHSGDTHNEIVDDMCRDIWRKELKNKKTNKTGNDEDSDTLGGDRLHNVQKNIRKTSRERKNGRVRPDGGERTQRNQKTTKTRLLR